MGGWLIAYQKNLLKKMQKLTYDDGTWNMEQANTQSN